MYVCVCVCVRARVRACMRACMRESERERDRQRDRSGGRGPADCSRAGISTNLVRRVGVRVSNVNHLLTKTNP